MNFNPDPRETAKREITKEFYYYLMACATEDRSPWLEPKVRGWIVAPTIEIANNEMIRLQRVMPSKMIVDRSLRNKSLFTSNGILIECKVGDNPEIFTGAALDAVLVSEMEGIKNFDAIELNIDARLNAPGRGLNGKGGIKLLSL